MRERKVETRRGIRVTVREGGSGPPLVFMHGVAGLLPEEPLLERLAQSHRVLAPLWPGYGEDEGEEKLEDMLDFTLHGSDVLDALEVERPHLVAHSFGGMVAAEMAVQNSAALSRLVLLSPYGLWLDDHPIADLFASTPFDQPKLLFADEAEGQKHLTAGLDFSDDGALTDFMVGNARRLGTAGKVLFPIPNRRIEKRLYRATVETLVVWGTADGLIPPAYADHWEERLPNARTERIDGVGHMLPVEAPDVVGEAIEKFLAGAD